MNVAKEKIEAILEDLGKLNFYEADLKSFVDIIRSRLGDGGYLVFLRNKLLLHSHVAEAMLKSASAGERRFRQTAGERFSVLDFRTQDALYRIYFERTSDLPWSERDERQLRLVLGILAQVLEIRQISRKRIIESQIINELNLNVINTLNERKIIWYIESAARKMLDTQDLRVFYSIDDKFLGSDKTLSLKILSDELYRVLFKQRQVVSVGVQERKFLSKVLGKDGINEAMIVPILVKNACRGFLIHYDLKRTGQLNLSITRLKFLANQAAIALERIELFGALHRTLKESKGLQELARVMLTPRDLHHFFDELLRRAQKILGFRKTLCSRYNPQTACFDRMAGIGISAKKLRQAKKVHPPLKLIKTLLQDRFRTFNSFYIPSEEVPEDVRGYELYSTVCVGRRMGTRWVPGDILMSPVYSRTGELLALLSFDEPDDGMAPTLDRIRLLEAFGDFLGLAIENHQLFEKVEKLSYTDEMTTVYNYRFFREKMRDLIHRNAAPTAIILVDLDNFKEYNDQYGHLHGDDVLKRISQLFVEVVGKKGFVTRYGGDEFIIILPNVGLKGARDTIRRTINKMDGLDRRLMPIRFSHGIAVFPGDGKDVGRLIDQADKRLYLDKAKRYHEKGQ